MKKSFILLNIKIVVVGIFVLACISFSAGAQEYSQDPILLDAAQVLPEKLLQGKNYKVDEKITNDGIFNIYSLTTDYGSMKVESTKALMIQINELNALKALEELHLGKIAAESVGKAAKAPIQGAVNLVKEPIETSKNIVKGTGQFLSNLGRSIYSDDDYQDNVFKVAVGYDAAKRQYAYEFGIDPYTDYDPLVDRLGSVAQATVGGSLLPKAVMAGMDENWATALQISGTAEGMRKLVRDKSPGELEKINLNKLEQMGVETSLAEAFLSNRRYTPQEETFLVGALENMQGVKDKSIFIRRATLAKDKSVALHYRMFAEMMAAYHKKVSQATRIVDSSGMLGLLKKDGRLVFLAPIDHIFWTENVEKKVNRLDSGISKMSGISGKEMWITGKIDNAALEHFKSRGWKFKENAGDTLF